MQNVEGDLGSVNNAILVERRYNRNPRSRNGLTRANFFRPLEKHCLRKSASLFCDQSFDFIFGLGFVQNGGSVDQVMCSQFNLKTCIAKQ